ncbi:hypothetical protein PoB_001778300 [Plakobranchus ocellatus]|uniref:Uncharacterized protein n=1 Tax=Plakobranchus ocellatus TaxID=259542 RepID=A0AAV3Z950_9GAST|nr:hypothetical protein PoB_001778300 [Plakobranchus ocellatus]
MPLHKATQSGYTRLHKVATQRLQRLENRWRLATRSHSNVSLCGVSGTVASESALRSPGTLLSQVRAQPPASWPDGGPKSLRSPCCGLAMYKNQTSDLITIG